MKGRVNWEGSQSESALVRGRYESPVEEHPGVSNQNLRWRVGLDGTIPLNHGRYRMKIHSVSTK